MNAKRYEAFGPKPGFALCSTSADSGGKAPEMCGSPVKMFIASSPAIRPRRFSPGPHFFHMTLWIGLNLLDRARAVAAFDRPTGARSTAFQQPLSESD